MKRRLTAIFMALALTFAMVGCQSHTHIVGSGSDSSQSSEARQWYILFGLVPLNDVDTKQMAGDDANYTITTEQTFLDIVIGFFTGIVTVNSRTVTVDN